MYIELYNNYIELNDKNIVQFFEMHVAHSLHYLAVMTNARDLDGDI